MTKPKERSELEYLRAENRRLKSENRNLKKQLGASNKKVNRYQNIIDTAEEPELTDPAAVVTYVPTCKECGAVLETTDIGVRLITKCTKCDFREVKRK